MLLGGCAQERMWKMATVLRDWSSRKMGKSYSFVAVYNEAEGAAHAPHISKLSLAEPCGMGHDLHTLVGPKRC